MSTTYLKTCTFILLISLTSLGIAETKETIIFTNNDNLLSEIPVSTTVYNLDTPEDLVSKMFGALSPESEIAKKQSRQIMSSPSWQQQDAALRESFKGVIKAWTLGVEKVPAVVMEGRFVVYGTTNVDVAREKLKQFQGGR